MLNEINNGVNENKVQVPKDFIKKVSLKSSSSIWKKPLYVIDDDNVRKLLEEKGFIK